MLCVELSKELRKKQEKNKTLYERKALKKLSKRLALIKRPLRLAGLIKRLFLKKLDQAVDKLLVRDNMKSAIRSPNLQIWQFARF